MSENNENTTLSPEVLKQSEDLATLSPEVVKQSDVPDLSLPETPSGAPGSESTVKTSGIPGPKVSGLKPPSKIGRPCLGAAKPALPPVPKSEYFSILNVLNTVLFYCPCILCVITYKKYY